MRLIHICIFLLFGLGLSAQIDYIGLEQLKWADTSGYVLLTDEDGIQRYVTVDSFRNDLNAIDSTALISTSDSTVNDLQLFKQGSLYATYSVKVKEVTTRSYQSGDTSYYINEVGDTSVYFPIGAYNYADSQALALNQRIDTFPTNKEINDTLSNYPLRTELQDTASDLRTLIGSKLDTSDVRVHVVDSTEEIQTLSSNLGDVIYDSNKGNLYQVKSDTVEHYKVDNEYIIPIGSNYAIVDFCDKREFDSYKEFKRIAPLLCFDGSTETVTIGDIDIKVSANPLMTSATDIYKDTIVDGFFVDTINVGFEGENRLMFSEYFIPVADNYGWIIEPEWYQDYGVNDELDKKAIMFTGIDNSDSDTRDVVGYLSNNMLWDSIYTVSFYYKVINSVDNDIQVWEEYNDEPVSLNTDGEWHRASITFPAASVNNVQLGIRNTVPTDTILMDRFQLEESPIATPYKLAQFKNSASSGKMYVNLGEALIDNGVLRLDRLGYNTELPIRQNGDDTRLIKNALNYSNSGSRFNEVQLGKGLYYLRDSVKMPNHVSIKGAVTHNHTGGTDIETHGTSIIVDIPDTSKNAFYFIRKNGDDTHKSGGLYNLDILIKDTINTAIFLEEAENVSLHNLTLNWYNNSNGYFTTGIEIATDVSSDSYNNSIENLYIKNGFAFGIIYEGSTHNNFFNIDINEADSVGFWNRGGNSSVVSKILLQDCREALRMTNGDATFYELYTEGSGFDGGGTIEMTGGRLRIVNSTLQSAGNSDTIIHVTGGTLFEVNNSSIRNPGAIIIDSIYQAKFINVESIGPLKYIRDNTVTKGITVDGNVRYMTNVPFNNKGGNKELSNIQQYDSELSDLGLNDEISLNSTLFKGSQINYIANSESFAPAGTYGSGTDSIVIKENTVIAPNGTQTAESIIYTGSDIGGSSVTMNSVNMLDSFQVGDSYTFTMYVKVFGDMIGSKELFELRFYSDPVHNDRLAFYSPSGEWTRVSKTGKILTTTGPDILIFRIVGANWDVVDSVAVWGAKLEKGSQYTGYYKTTTNGINTDSVVLQTLGEKPINIKDTTKFEMPIKIGNTRITNVGTPSDLDIFLYNATNSQMELHNIDTNSYWKEGVVSTDIHYSGGDVGIGTNSPSAVLDVVTTTGVSNIDVLKLNSPANTKLTIESTGGSAYPMFDLVTPNQDWRIQLDGGGKHGFKIRDFTRSVDRVYIDTSGNFGIGVGTSPSALLDVGGGAIIGNTKIDGDGTPTGGDIYRYNGITEQMELVAPMLSGSGSPSGVVTPDFIRQEYLDTDTDTWYKATGLTNTDWVALN